MKLESHLPHCNFIKTHKLSYFRIYKKTPNTGEINTRRPMKQRKTKIYLGRRMWRTGWGQVSESMTNSRRSADVWKIHQGSNIRKGIREREVLPCHSWISMPRTKSENRSVCFHISQLRLQISYLVSIGLW